MLALKKSTLLLTLGLCGIGITIFLLSNTPRGKTLTDTFFDPIRVTSSRQEVAIVGIDDTSLQRFGSWPWDRSIFAQLQTALTSAGVRAIAYDVLFLEDRAGDEAFLESLTKNKTPTFLASKINGNNYLESHLVGAEPFMRSSFANVQPDADGKVRKYPPSVVLNKTCTYGLAESVFRFMTFTTSTTCNAPVDTSFRYPLSIPTYSVSDILEGKITAGDLKGTVVFVGSTSLDLADHFVSLTGEKIPGVYVHGSILTSLLNSVADRHASKAISLLSFVVAILFTALLLTRIERILLQLGALVALIVSTFIVSGVVFQYGILLPAPWLLLAIVLTSGYTTFARFLAERTQNKYIQTLFSKYVHKDVLTELIRSNEPVRLGGEKKEVTILFSDLRGFTTLSEKLTAEELTGLLNAYFTSMTPHILEEKGTIDKFIGDAIMAFWNAPLTIPDHTIHAVSSALRMQRALSDFNKAHNTKLEMGIGVHRGEVVVGNVGGKDRVNYTILGDTVNLTSRLEGLTKKYGVKTIITEDVYTELDQTLGVTRLLDVITVKGKTLPTKIYEVLDTSDANTTDIKQYEKGFALYQKGLWADAKAMLSNNKDDIPSKVLLERILVLEKGDAAWDGVWRFDEK